MAYKTEDLFKKAIELAKDKNKKLIFVDDLVAYLGINRSTFYRHFPRDSNKYNKLRAILDETRIQIKVALRAKWFTGDNATTQLALYRLLATSEEHELLNQSSNHNGKHQDDNEPKTVGFKYDIIKPEEE